MSDEGFTIIYDWMIEELNLSGSRLFVYAVIYGFSKDGDWFQGSISFLMGKTGLSRRCVIDTLSALVRDGLIYKKDRPHKGIHYTDYRVSGAKSALVQNLHQGGAKSAPRVVQNLHIKEYKKIKRKDNARARTRKKYIDYPQRDPTNLDYVEAVLTGKVSNPSDKDLDDDIESNS